MDVYGWFFTYQRPSMFLWNWRGFVAGGCVYQVFIIYLFLFSLSLTQRQCNHWCTHFCVKGNDDILGLHLFFEVMRKEKNDIETSRKDENKRGSQ